MSLNKVGNGKDRRLQSRRNCTLVEGMDALLRVARRPHDDQEQHG